MAGASLFITEDKAFAVCLFFFSLLSSFFFFVLLRYDLQDRFKTARHDHVSHCCAFERLLMGATQGEVFLLLCISWFRRQWMKFYIPPLCFCHGYPFLYVWSIVFIMSCHSALDTTIRGVSYAVGEWCCAWWEDMDCWCFCLCFCFNSWKRWPWRMDGLNELVPGVSMCGLSGKVMTYYSIYIEWEW